MPEDDLGVYPVLNFRSMFLMSVFLCVTKAILCSISLLDKMPQFFGTI
jgi:hypothetical protein